MRDEEVYEPPPIQGYRAMTQSQVDLVNTVKRAEQTVLAMLRNLSDDADIDPPTGIPWKSPAAMLPAP